MFSARHRFLTPTVRSNRPLSAHKARRRILCNLSAGRFCGRKVWVFHESGGTDKEHRTSHSLRVNIRTRAGRDRDREKERAANSRSVSLAMYPSRVLWPQILKMLHLRGLNVRIPGFSGRTPAGELAQPHLAPRAKGALHQILIEWEAPPRYPTRITPDPTVPAPVVNEYPLLPLPAGVPSLASTESITREPWPVQERSPEGRREIHQDSSVADPWDTCSDSNSACVDGAQREETSRNSFAAVRARNSEWRSPR